MAMDTNTATDTAVDTSNNGNWHDRGVVGTASAGLTIRQLWHASNTGLSLKQFARQLLKGKDEAKALTAREWFANKRGSKNAKRSDANIKAAFEAAAKSKIARRKGSGGSK
jgi:hypothetical protein